MWLSMSYEVNTTGLESQTRTWKMCSEFQIPCCHEIHYVILVISPNLIYLSYLNYLILLRKDVIKKEKEKIKVHIGNPSCFTFLISQG